MGSHAPLHIALATLLSIMFTLIVLQSICPAASAGTHSNIIVNTGSSAVLDSSKKFNADVDID